MSIRSISKAVSGSLRASPTGAAAWSSGLRIRTTPTSVATIRSRGRASGSPGFGLWSRSDARSYFDDFSVSVPE
jgi:hypothetical protein